MNGLNADVQYRMKSVKASVLCAWFGFLLALLLATVIFALFGVPIYQISFDVWFFKPIIIGTVVLFLSSALFGWIAGQLLTRVKPGLVPLIGVTLALGCLICAAVVGASVNYVEQLSDRGAFYDYLVRPTVTVLIVGFIPAVVLGLIYSAMMRKTALA